MTHKKNFHTLVPARTFEAQRRIEGQNTRVRPGENGTFDVLWSTRFIDIRNAQESEQQ